MSWEAASTISEIVGATAVVVSLIYLALQIRSSSQATRAAVHLGLHDSFAQIDSLMISDPNIAAIFERVSAGDATLSSTEKTRASFLLAKLFNRYELFYFLNRDDLFAPDVQIAVKKNVEMRLAEPGIKTWWGDHQALYSPDFIEWVNGIDTPS